MTVARKPRMGAQYTPKTIEARIDVDTTTSVRAALTLPSPDGKLDVALAIGHGAGSNMDQPILIRMAEAFAREGALVLRFNFVYSDTGRRSPDRPQVLIATWRAAAAWLAARPEAKGRPLVLGGKSMGGRIASHLVALGDPADGLLFLGYPLHPAGQPGKLRDAHLGAIRAPMLFVAGTRDPLCDLALLRPVLKKVGRRATLARIDDGDHSFHVRKSSGRDDAAATAEVVRTCVKWLEKRSPGAGPSPA